MPTEVIMPKVDMDMAAGTIVVWHAVEGDRVEKSAPLFDIETDKATMEVESPASGILHHVTAREGASVPIGQAVAWVYAEGEAVGDAPNGQPLSEQPAPANDRVPVEGASVAFAPAEVSAGRTDGTRATPLARRTAREHGLTLSDLDGSGPRGRITKADVEAAVAGGVPAAAPAAQPAAAPAAPAAAPAAAGPSAAGLADAFGQAYTEVKNSNMRKTVARRLTEAKQTVPHFYLTVDCELDALLATRKELNERAPDGVKLSVND
ncbi:MAG: E3 binding domain-containing protein, partial [Pseudomonadota bacterium]